MLNRIHIMTMIVYYWLWFQGIRHALLLKLGPAMERGDILLRTRAWRV
jgi:hypothetical protein